MSAYSPSVRGVALACVLGLGCLVATSDARAEIDGLTGSSFSLSAEAGYVSMPDGASVYSWGYSANGTMQLPGPTLIVTEDTPVTITLTNNLPVAAGNVSLVVPGMVLGPPAPPAPQDGVPGPLTREATPGGTVTYTFTPSEPGTYAYHSGSTPDLQVEMGLYGAIVVRPAAASVPAACTDPDNPEAGAAYAHAQTCFDREYLFVLSEIDLDVHQKVEFEANGGLPIEPPEGPRLYEYWLINGRAAPDTLTAAGTTVLPSQPYNSLPTMYPGQRVLCRIVGGGTDTHPFHLHGNHVRVLARDGHLLVSETDATKLAGPSINTVPTRPGATHDAIFEWTGENLGWDMYGHTDPTDPAQQLQPFEDPSSHLKPIPVELPDLTTLAFGGFYSGSPFLGAAGALPPGEGGLNPNAGFAYMWHSHAERELINNDIYPGGMLTMMIVVPWPSPTPATP